MTKTQTEGQAILLGLLADTDSAIDVEKEAVHHAASRMAHLMNQREKLAKLVRMAGAA